MNLEGLFIGETDLDSLSRIDSLLDIVNCSIFGFFVGNDVLSDMSASL